MLRILGNGWRKWLKFAEILGNIQMIILLSIIYWTMLLTLALPFKLLADPLGLKKRQPPQWKHREHIADVLESMRRQG